MTFSGSVAAERGSHAVASPNDAELGSLSRSREEPGLRHRDRRHATAKVMIQAQWVTEDETARTAMSPRTAVGNLASRFLASIIAHYGDTLAIVRRAEPIIVTLSKPRYLSVVLVAFHFEIETMSPKFIGE